MNEEHDKHLFTKYEKLIKDLPYISVNDGWFLAVSNLLSGLYSYDIKVVQIKEKFGSLRVYIEGSSNISEEEMNQAYEIVRKYENLSCNICETCGSPGKIVSCHGWLKTLCEDHLREFQEKHGG